MSERNQVRNQDVEQVAEELLQELKRSVDIIRRENDEREAKLAKKDGTPQSQPRTNGAAASKYADKLVGLLKCEPLFKECAFVAVLQQELPNRIVCVVLPNQQENVKRFCSGYDIKRVLIELRQKSIATVSVELGEKPTVQVSGGNLWATTEFIEKTLYRNAELALEDIEPFPINGK